MVGRFLKVGEEGGASWTGNQGEGGLLRPPPGSQHRAACRQLQDRQPGYLGLGIPAQPTTDDNMLVHSGLWLSFL